MNRQRALEMQEAEWFLGLERRLEELSREGNPLEKLAAMVNLKCSGLFLLRALRRG